MNFTLKKVGAGCSVKKATGTAMRLNKKTWNHKGQTIIEYAMVAAIITAAVIAMSTYVFRSVQGTQQVIQKEFRLRN